MPILVLAIDPFQYWHYMINTSTGRHTPMPVLVLARVAERKIRVRAPTGYAHTSIGNRSVLVLVLAKSRECQCWYKRDSNVAMLVLETMYAADGKRYFGLGIIGPDFGKEGKH